HDRMRVLREQIEEAFLLRHQRLKPAQHGTLAFGSGLAVGSLARLEASGEGAPFPTSLPDACRPLGLIANRAIRRCLDAVAGFRVCENPGSVPAEAGTCGIEARKRMTVLLYFESFASVLVLLASATVLAGWILLRLMDGFVRIYLAITEPETR